MHGVAEDYRTLLADGIVGFTHHSVPLSSEESHGWEEDHRQWASELAALAEADGLRAGLFYMHSPMIAYGDAFDLDPCVALLHGDHSRDPDSNIYPYDRQKAAAWHRPRAEAEWGETLMRARRRAGVSAVVS